MRPVNRTAGAALAAFIVIMMAAVPLAQANSQLVLTVQELIQRDHQVTVPAGTEILWRDVHFDRVWFPSASGAPRVERAQMGFRAVFTKPGTYHGRFTIVGGHRSDDIYPMTVTVTD